MMSNDMEGGKYSKETEKFLLDLPAGAVCVVVVDGPKGSGFSIATLHPSIMKPLPALFRQVADLIELDLARGYSVRQHILSGKDEE